MAPPAALPAGVRGVVAVINTAENVVVLDFGRNEIPSVHSQLSVYRDGVVVGTVLITDPVKPPLATADVLSGTLQRGDVIR